MGACCTGEDGKRDKKYREEAKEDNMDELNGEAYQAAADEFVINKTMIDPSEEEFQFRSKNAKDIMSRRWQWYTENREVFALVLKRSGFAMEDIRASMNGERPLGMPLPLYTDFLSALTAAVKKANTRVSTETGRTLQLRVILQGSYIPGYSSNPRKGDRFLPNYIFDPYAGSDFDFRVYADGLGDYVRALRESGKDIKDWGVRSPDSAHIIQPFSIALIFPEFEELCNAFFEMSKPYHKGQGVGLQASVVTENKGFEPHPWDMEINIE